MKWVHPDALPEVAQALISGEIVVVPTETVYGIASTLEPSALLKVFAAKGRPEYKPLILGVADSEMARTVTAEWPQAAEDLAIRFWPGPLSLVLPKAEGIPYLVTAGGATVAVRAPAHPVSLELIHLVGRPLVLTSANRTGEVLQMLSLQRQSGLLVVKKKGARVTLAFKDGSVRLVTAENLGNEFLLGRILVREGLMEARELELFLSNRKGSRRRLGSQVVKLGYVSAPDLQKALVRQSSELVYELLRWGHGRFELHRMAELPEQVLEFDFGISMDELLMEGFRRVDEWGLIESVLPSLEAVPVRVPGGHEHLEPVGLTAEEEAVFAQVDGSRRVTDIVVTVGKGTFETARILYRLLSARVVALRQPPADA